MNLRKTVKQVALVAAGAVLAMGGSMGSAHAFNFFEGNTSGANFGNPDAGDLFGGDGVSASGRNAQTVTGSFDLGANTITGLFGENGRGADLFKLPSFTGVARNITGVLQAAQLNTTSSNPTGLGAQGTPASRNVLLYLFQQTGTSGGLPVATLITSGTGTNQQFSATLQAGVTYFLGVTRQNNQPTLVNGVLTGWARGVTDPSTAYRVGITATPVPEPFTMLGGAAAVGVGGMMQRKRKQKKLAAQKAE